MLKNKSLPQKALFKTIVAILVVMFSVTLPLAVANYKISTNYLVESSNELKKDTLNVYQQEMENILNGLNRQIQVFLLSDNVWNMAYAYGQPDYLALRTILQEMKNNYYASSLIDSIYLFDQVHDFILADGYYKKNVFFDPIVLTDEFLKTTTISEVRTVNGKEIFSIVYQPMTNLSSNILTVVINLSVSEFYKILPFSSVMGHFVITNSDGNILYSSSESSYTDEIIANSWNMLNSQNVLKIDNTTFLVTQSKPTLQGLRLFVFQDYQSATHSGTLLARTLFILTVSILAGAILLSLAAAFYLYHPLQKLIDELDIGIGDNKNNNEYAMIGQAFHLLESSNDEYAKKLSEVSRSNNQYLLQEFLINPVMNAEKFTNLLQKSGVSFREQQYSLLLLEVQTLSDTESIDMTPPAIENTDICFIEGRISSTRFAYLINHKPGFDLNPISNMLNDHFHEMGFNLLIVFSPAFDCIEDLPAQFNYCELTLKQQIFLGSNLQKEDFPNVTKETAVLRKNILDFIKKGDKENARQALDSLIKVYSEKYPPVAMEFIRHQLLNFSSELLTLSHNENDSSFIFSKEYDYYKHISSAVTLKEIHSELNSLIESKINESSNLTTNRNEAFVKNAIEYIDQNIISNPSLDEIAHSVYLSTNYFCSIFKSITGMTVMDYVTDKRIALSCQLLIDHPEKKVNEIASLLGYNSPQSYIRQFKKTMQTTPDQFRKSSLLSIEM